MQPRNRIILFLRRFQFLKIILIILINPYCVLAPQIAERENKHLKCYGPKTQIYWTNTGQDVYAAEWWLEVLMLA